MTSLALEPTRPASVAPADPADPAGVASAGPERRLWGLDGLRGIAILLVVPHNLLPVAHPTGLGETVLMAWLERGWVGVQLFFALSGFLITGILLDTRRARHSLRVFYARRALRIFPVYYLLLVLMLCVAPALHWPPHAAADASPVWWSYWFYLSNWFMPFFPGQFTLPHLWSLAVEEQFYLVWPFLVIWWRPRGVIVLSMGLVIASLASRLALLSWHGAWPGAPELAPDLIYELTVCRMDALVLGAAAAAALRVPALAALFARYPQRLIAALVVSWVLTAAVSHFHAYGAMQQSVGYLLLAVSCALTVLVVAQADLSADSWRSGAAWLRAAWLRNLGRYSYAMYVLHVPVAILLGRPLLAHWLGDLTPEAARQAVLSPMVLAGYLVGGCLVTYLLAWCSWHGIERWCLRFKPPYVAADADTGGSAHGGPGMWRSTSPTR